MTYWFSITYSTVQYRKNKMSVAFAGIKRFDSLIKLSSQMATCLTSIPVFLPLGIKAMFIYFRKVSSSMKRGTPNHHSRIDGRGKGGCMLWGLLGEAIGCFVGRYESCSGHWLYVDSRDQAAEEGQFHL
ncbi:hypothetical protein SAY87_026230 [Trapa incisa]|uniref:Uncharacterized protein n=1 Tax=Trapa incisa TaxID=236973 RepID=A0AAN7GLS9_9MYRT|nr:hypothetical protein SAY87_026230 [Trapa incisa]